MSIPLSRRLPNDTLCWDLEKSGEYSVRTTYRALFGDEWRREEVAPSNTGSLWKRVWQTKVLPRVKLFVWRACLNALPTRLVISRRVAATYDEYCGVCNREDESILHALRDCVMARVIWSRSEMEHLASWRYCSLLDWWEAAFEEMDEEAVSKFFTLCWEIWGARNKVVVANGVFEPDGTVEYAMKVSKEFWEEYMSGKSRGRGVGSSHQTEWKPPDEGWVKVNVDAGLLGEMGSGLGAVVRNASGGVERCAVSQGVERWDPLIAEAKAVMLGPQLGAELGARKIIVESDCLVLINALQEGAPGAGSLGLMLEDIFDSCSSFDSVRWSFIKRVGNQITHNLAHLQPWSWELRVWEDEFPNCVLLDASSDLLI